MIILFTNLLFGKSKFSSVDSLALAISGKPSKEKIIIVK